MTYAVIAGGLGYIGTPLAASFKDLGFKVLVLTRTFHELPKNADAVNPLILDYSSFAALVREKPDAEYLIINLAGENLGARRVGRKRLLELKNSRLNVIKTLKSACPKPLAFFQASGYSALHEDVKDPFLKLALEVESAAAAEFSGICPVFDLRFGLVISDKAQAVKLLKRFPGLYFIGGTNHLPYTTLDDAVSKVCRIVQRMSVIKKKKEAVTHFNIFTRVVTLNELMRLVQGRFVRLPIPKFFLKHGDLRGRLLLQDLIFKG